MRRPGSLLLLRLAAAALASVGAYAGALGATGNVHEVVPGALWRAAQPDAATLARLRDEAGIRTVINLRGAHPGSDWYDAEIAASRDLGLAHLDFAMSATKPLPPERVAELVALMQSAERPLLIHCRGGADRSGLASALFVAAVAEGGHDAAERQLSILYGHIGLEALSRAAAMDATWEAMEPALGFPDS